ncbi:hypothetical protein IQ06DRAFT_289744 [Phaeosphaeriaceae sp. SRC1lsM3a]|nr:hypothetical protein IQ06DRAFT_289744 [Stagonospora sp. SRC1lsM3a]
MDPQTDLPDLVEDFEVNIDELTETLAPLLNTQLSTTASSLPLLDKAKLYVLAAYSVESLLYSTLQASGGNAKEHAIFKELARLKAYFGKIKEAEERVNAPAPKAKLDVGAAARFIKHGLAGNDKYDLERAERMAKERARAQLKAKQINKKFDENGEEPTAGKKREIEDIEHVVEQEEADDAEAATINTEPSSKKLKVATPEDAMDVDSAHSSAGSHASSKKGKKNSKRGSKTSKSADPSDNDEVSPSQSQDLSQDDPNQSSARPKRKQRGKKNKKDINADSEMAEAGQEVSSTPARTTRKQAAAVTANAANAVESEAGASAEKPKRGRGRPRKSK